MSEAGSLLAGCLQSSPAEADRLMTLLRTSLENGQIKEQATTKTDEAAAADEVICYTLNP